MPNKYKEVFKVFKEAISEGRQLPRIRLNTKQLINTLTGKYKNFVENIEKEQEEKYGNYDVFEVTIDELAIEIQFGESWETFYFREDGTIRDTNGTYQGGRYETWFKLIAVELFNLVRSEDL